MWAWKKPAKDGNSAEYTRLAGDVTFDGVDFGYNPDKMVLHDIKMYATPGQKIAFVGRPEQEKLQLLILSTVL